MNQIDIEMILANSSKSMMKLLFFIKCFLYVISQNNILIIGKTKLLRKLVLWLSSFILLLCLNINQEMFKLYNNVTIEWVIILSGQVMTCYLKWELSLRNVDKSLGLKLFIDLILLVFFFKLK